eukprot:sb/3477200/
MSETTYSVVHLLQNPHYPTNFDTLNHMSNFSKPSEYLLGTAQTLCVGSSYYLVFTTTEIFQDLINTPHVSTRPCWIDMLCVSSTRPSARCERRQKRNTLTARQPSEFIPL